MRLFTGFIIVTRHAYKSIIIAVKTEQPQFCAFLYFYQKSYQYALLCGLIPYRFRHSLHQCPPFTISLGDASKI